MSFNNTFFIQNYDDPNKFQNAIDSMDRVTKSTFQWCKITPDGDIIVVGLLQRIFDFFKKIFISTNNQSIDFYNKNLTEIQFLKLLKHKAITNITSLSNNIDKIKNIFNFFYSKNLTINQESRNFFNYIDEKDFEKISSVVDRFLKNYPSEITCLFERKVEPLSISIPDSFKKTSDEQIILTDIEKEPPRAEQTSSSPKPESVYPQLAVSPEVSTGNSPDKSESILPDSSSEPLPPFSEAILTKVEMQQIYPDNASTLTINPSESLKQTIENTEKLESIATAVPSNEHTDLYSKSPVKTEPNSSVTTTPPVKLAQQPNIVKTAFLGLLAFSGSVFLSQNYLNFYDQYPIAIPDQPYQDTPSLALDLYQKNSNWLGTASTTADETMKIAQTCPFLEFLNRISYNQNFTNESRKFTTNYLIGSHVIRLGLFIGVIRVFFFSIQALSEEVSERKKLIHFINKINYRLSTLRESRA